MAPPRRLHETPMAVEGSRTTELIGRFRVAALLQLLPAFVSGFCYRPWVSRGTQLVRPDIRQSSNFPDA
jgi:hypothetical protein